MPDISGLSSNWKKLQSSLKAAPKKENGDKGVKRKRPGESSADPNNPNFTAVKKRVKVEVKKPEKPQVTVKKNMGGAFSKSASSVAGSRPSSQPVTHVAETDATSTGPVARRPSSRPVSIAGSTETLVNQGLHPTHKPGKFLALDCEMVGTGPPPSAENVLARVSVVNYHGEQVYDSYVQPLPGVEVTDYRTFVSGIKPHHLRSDVARPFAEVQKTVAELLDGKVLVGHALKNDMAVLLLSHPQRDIRDTAKHANFRKISMGRAPALRKLAKERLGLEIQGGEHSSVEDARATMSLFRLEKDVFEQEVQQRYGPALRRERKAREAEAKQVMRALPQRVMDDEEDDEEEEEEEELDDNGDVIPKSNPGGKKKKKNKKKKRTKRA
ncbi:hypothetical protein AAFC00_000296 [Neodothiora populina]|uniref:RNA exonuclease 4 n=1 Tax=Neodothiora populina TaxID=2781224 RepID=A0ABR3PCH8_9PEZI